MLYYGMSGYAISDTRNLCLHPTKLQNIIQGKLSYPDNSMEEQLRYKVTTQPHNQSNFFYIIKNQTSLTWKVKFDDNFIDRG